MDILDATIREFFTESILTGTAFIRIWAECWKGARKMAYTRRVDNGYVFKTFLFSICLPDH
jgi:hypothetical protein